MTKTGLPPEDDEQIAMIIKAMLIIREKHGNERGLRGEIECPKCGSVLRYSISSYNGHCHGWCTKTGCIGWMQ